jgi:hypothetical protein
MTKFKFTITRDVTESVVVEAEADTIEDAMEQATMVPPTEGWEIDDNPPGVSYLPDPSDFEEIVPPKLQTFTVRRLFDAYIIYQAEIQATSPEEAMEISEDDDSIKWEDGGTSEFDHYDKDVWDADGNEVMGL